MCRVLLVELFSKYCDRRNAMKHSSFALAIALFANPVFHHLTAQEPSPLFNIGGGFTDDPRMIQELERLDAQQRKSMQEITIRVANLFHKRFIDTCMEALPREVTLQYVGLLGTDNGRLKVRVLTDDVRGSLKWYVHADVVIFDMWISTMRTKETVAKCVIEKQDIFVNVLFVDGKRGLDDALTELGGRSVRRILSLLEGRRVKEKPPCKDTLPKRD